MTRRTRMLGIRHVAGCLQLLAAAIYSLAAAQELGLVLMESSQWKIYADIHLLSYASWSVIPVLRQRRLDVFLEHRSFNFRDRFPCESFVIQGPVSSPSLFCAEVSTGLPLGSDFWMPKVAGYLEGEYRFRFMWEDQDVEEDGNVSTTSMVGYSDIPLVSYVKSLASWDVIDTREESDMAFNGTLEHVSLFIQVSNP